MFCQRRIHRSNPSVQLSNIQPSSVGISDGQGMQSGSGLLALLSREVWNAMKVMRWALLKTLLFGLGRLCNVLVQMTMMGYFFGCVTFLMSSSNLQPSLPWCFFVFLLFCSRTSVGNTEFLKPLHPEQLGFQAPLVTFQTVTPECMMELLYLQAPQFERSRSVLEKEVGGDARDF